MKKSLIYLASGMFCFASLVSCEGDDDPSYTVPNYLAGNWRLTEIGSLNSQNVLVYTDVETNGCEFDTVIFGEDYTYDDSDFESVGGNCTETTTTGMYVINNGNIEMTAPDSPFEAKTLDMLVLTDTTLEVSYTDAETEELVFERYTKI
ncbi:MAG TPA: lipocalin family protein [Flavobacterium sp.]|jgi:hypothetical protein